MVIKKKAFDDEWTYQKVSTPFPPSAVRAHQNQYVAMWYRHGVPVMGRAWNDCGVVLCEFAHDKKTFTAQEVGGSIQLLTYEGTHITKSFYYEWVRLALWKSEHGNELAIRQIVHCGNAAPIFWPEHEALGNYDIEGGKAWFSVKGQFIEVADQTVLSEMRVVVRNLEGGPPHCPCPQCNEKQKTAAKPLMVNDWNDVCYGVPWPTDKPLVKALGRPLKTPAGPEEHIVALWYRHGNPLMGRAWNRGGKMDASFTDNGHEYTGVGVGSLQTLMELPATAAGFDYTWMPYEQASNFHEKDYAPVHINFVAPCVVVDAKNNELLGQVNLKKERAEASFNGQVVVREGPLQLNHLMVLCRKDRDDTYTI